jgi:hypothetical protein
VWYNQEDINVSRDNACVPGGLGKGWWQRERRGRPEGDTALALPVASASVYPIMVPESKKQYGREKLTLYTQSIRVAWKASIASHVSYVLCWGV